MQGRFAGLQTQPSPVWQLLEKHGLVTIQCTGTQRPMMQFDGCQSAVKKTSIMHFGQQHLSPFSSYVEHRREAIALDDSGCWWMKVNVQRGTKNPSGSSPKSRVTVNITRFFDSHLLKRSTKG